ncbi:PREDICTED: uncharacterized protein LOC104809036 [Tarenaya hassleriana]|uniref:uncharacterized protein LOC104809036 n=1 Tax=Tarenaya hassleriana TaxID=28532 RepID=UPI00053C8CDC|nr:PREDICTED: uncharacterized protein LOC104809036 [Tarenaya hassleriana]
MSRPIPVEEMVKQFKGRHSCTHLLRMDNFSLVRKHNIGMIESSVFSIAGYKWNLVLYPTGDENPNSKGHVSLYLQIQDLKSLPSNWQLSVRFKLFVLNQFRQIWHENNGDVVFSQSNNMWGFRQTISLAALDDSTQGYLVGDCVMFGVKFLGVQDCVPGTAERFTLIEKPPNNKVTWKMTKFSTFLLQTDHKSNEFSIGGRKWRILLYPRGFGDGQDNSLSVYLRGDEHMDNVLKTKTFAKFKLRVLDQIARKHHEQIISSHWFTVEPGSWGFSKFMPLGDLHDPSKGYLVNDMCYVGAEIDVISMTTPL